MLERPSTRSRKRRSRKATTAAAAPGNSGVILYGRVSTAEQATEGASLFAQRSTLESWASTHGYGATEWIEDAGVSGRSLDREGMQKALGMLTSGQATMIVAVSLSRLSRSVIDAASLLELAEDTGFAVVALDLGINTSTSGGRLVANVLAAVAAWELDVVSERTKAGMAAKAAQGVRIGRPVELPEAVRADIVAMREDLRMSYSAIAARLNERGISSARGSKWHPGSVHSVLHRSNSPEVQNETGTPPGGVVDESGTVLATTDANGRSLIVPGPGGLAYRDGVPVNETGG